MYLRMFHTLLSCFIVCTIAFEDIMYVYGQTPQEIVEMGKAQYQILRDRGNLPKYGTCWKSAVEHLHDGCRHLSEDVQSDMALHLTNCFLEMSGHKTYRCEHDKKPNLRGICINSMSDRAFNVYTEFYTHTQNMCWFLHGQVWYEAIVENTLKVGEQLKTSAKNQDELLKNQRDSLALQEQMLIYGQALEEIMEEFVVSSQKHQQLLSMVSKSLNNLQSWLLGEVSLVDTILFYVGGAILITVFTSSPRTASARLPLLFVLCLNILVERLICSKLVLSVVPDIHSIQNDLYKYVWWCRYTYVTLSMLILLYKLYAYRNINEENYALLKKVYEQTCDIHKILQGKGDLGNYSKNNRASVINESLQQLSRSTKNEVINYHKPLSFYSLNNYVCDNNFQRGDDGVNKISKEPSVVRELNRPPSTKKEINIFKNEFAKSQDIYETPKENVCNKFNYSRRKLFSGGEALGNGGYNLRSRQGTPDVNS